MAAPGSVWCLRITAVAALCSFMCCVLCLRYTPGVAPHILHEIQASHGMQMSDTVVAIGDLHGDVSQAQAALSLVGLTDSSGEWQARSGTVVQTGDLLDRGPDSLALVRLFETLKASASQAGGHVHTLLGNHEVMNLMGDYRYINPAELTGLAETGASGHTLPQNDHVQGLDIWKQHMQQDHAIGRALRARAAAVILGQGHCKTLFIHAGLSPQMLQTLVEHSQASQSPTALLKTLNNLVTGAVKKCSVGSTEECNAETATLITDPDSVVWYRGYVHQYERELCPQVKQVLQAMQVQRIVAGHNVMSNGRIKSLCGGKVNLIDVGMSRAYLGNLAVWKCTNGTAYAVHAGGKEFILKLTDPVHVTPLQ